MAYRPDATVVISLTGTELDQAVVDSLIDDAMIIAKDCASQVDDAVAKAAVKWLAAHLVATADPYSRQMTSDSLGNASTSWSAAKVSDGLDGTAYGQQAVAILPCLANAGESTVSIQVI